MPYPLTVTNKNDKTSIKNEQTSYYMRISAINAEVGEGPYSNYIELRTTTTSNYLFFFILKYQSKNLIKFINKRIRTTSKFSSQRVVFRSYFT